MSTTEVKNVEVRCHSNGEWEALVVSRSYGVGCHTVIKDTYFADTFDGIIEKVRRALRDIDPDYDPGTYEHPEEF